MARPVDPEVRAEAVELVRDEGLSYSAAAREVGVSWMAVRNWCLAEGVLSPQTRPDFAYTATQGALERFWEDSALPGPSPRTLSQNAGNPRPGRSGGRAPLFVGFTSERGRYELPRPDLPEGAVVDRGGLQEAMERWSARVATSTAADVVERHCRSTWDASTR